MDRREAELALEQIRWQSQLEHWEMMHAMRSGVEGLKCEFVGGELDLQTFERLVGIAVRAEEPALLRNR